MAKYRRIQGYDSYARKLKAIPRSVRDGLRQANMASAQQIAAAIKAVVPVRTGELRRSVAWCEGLPPRSEATQAIRIPERNLTDRQRALSDAGLLFSVYEGDGAAYYARWVEFGTKASGPSPRLATRVRTRAGWRTRLSDRKRTRSHHATRPRPHFYPTARRFKKPAAARASRAIGKAVRAVASSQGVVTPS